MHRWAVCPGSVRLSEGVPKTESKYAKEGTLAHEIASRLLLGQEISVVSQEMMDAVLTYVQEVNGAMDPLINPKGCLLVEQKFDLSSIYRGLYGTADAVVYNPTKSLLQVFDYKHGAGISVDVENNEQLMYYGLGALLAGKYICKEIELVVVQPRVESSQGPVKRWRFPTVDIIDFAADLKDFAAETENPDARLVTGDHCRFCPAAAYKCPEIHKQAIVTAQREFSPAFSYDAQQLADTIRKIPAIKAFIKNVEEFAENEALAGRMPPGFKLVQKKSNRKWADEKAVISHIAQNVAPSLYSDCFTDPELKSPAQLEKVLGKDKKWVDDFTTREPGGLTLVLESDKRPSAQVDPQLAFATVETINELL